MADCCCTPTSTNAVLDPRQRRILWLVLALNLAMFVAEFAGGLWAGSSALLGDSVDMLLDAIVYGVSLAALGRSARMRAGAGLLNGILQLGLGLVVLATVAHHLAFGVQAVGPAMMVVAALALAVNLLCAGLLMGYRHQDINMRSLWLCTRNDAVGNAATIAAGGLVTALAAAWPDWLLGGLLAVLLLRTAVGVMREAVTELRDNPPATASETGSD